MGAMSIEIANESGMDVDDAALVSLARHVLDAMKIHPQAELSILLVDEAAMEELHVKWMDEPGPTDVLSFPMDELRPPRGDDDGEAEPGLLGDVVICPQVAARQGRRAGHGFADEVNLLLTHGILHLLGYDHAQPDEEREMFGLQAKLLGSWWEERSARPGATSGPDAGSTDGGLR
jgi:probable rRNA maturation factor